MHYLYFWVFPNDSNGEIACISCVDSCIDCEPNPNCFKFANFVVHDGDACRVYPAGYKLSFSDRFIIFDLAHSSSKIF
ncbi:unnamed protein product [Blepharisma stoltei]|uniref:Uncharacterized protein n=1 Tax=Blepharisma stoltei TaxID=1481888 RepID=A0AAU9JVQ7_9CILI|nr:unnamed protein product [Blepharisma stoltei]